MLIETGPFSGFDVHSPEQCLTEIDCIGSALSNLHRLVEDPDLREILVILTQKMLDVRIGVTVHSFDNLLEIDPVTQAMLNEI